MRILILYSTVDGQTLRICRRIEQVCSRAEHHVVVADLENSDIFEPSLFDAVVVGASIRYGKHRPSVVRYLRDNRDRVKAFFTVNLVARKPEKNSADTNPYMKTLLARIGWRPALLGVFAGKIDYASLGFFDRNVIRFIMLMTKGPTGPKGTFEFTDWAKVDAFAREVAR
jgi:menaquinone-dependent protoporphyrinogen oxidase